MCLSIGQLVGLGVFSVLAIKKNAAVNVSVKYVPRHAVTQSQLFNVLRSYTLPCKGAVPSEIATSSVGVLFFLQLFWQFLPVLIVPIVECGAINHFGCYL